MTTSSNYRVRGYKVSPKSNNDIEFMACEVRDVLAKWGLIDGDSVNVKKVLEQLFPALGYTYKILAPDEMPDYEACVIPGEELIFIRQDVYDNLQEDEGRARFTIMHELAHVVLKHHVTLHRNGDGSHKIYEDSEWQADGLAAALLMPKNICLASDNAFELARRCGVSNAAANIRMSKIKKPHF